MLHDQRGSNVAQAVGVAIVAAALIGALLRISPGLAGAVQQNYSCLAATLGGAAAACSAPPSATGRPTIVAFAPPSNDDLPPDQYPAPDGTRPLTAQERALAEQIFGPGALDLDAVLITRDGPFLQQRPYVLGNTIHWPHDTIDSATLAHELTHVYQFQQRGWVYLDEALALQIDYEILKILGVGSNPYDYGGVEGLEQAREDGKTFGDFNVEQQGEIVQDYWERRRNGDDTSAYDPFIEDLHNGDLEDDYEEPSISLPIPVLPVPPLDWVLDSLIFNPFPFG